MISETVGRRKTSLHVMRNSFSSFLSWKTNKFSVCRVLNETLLFFWFSYFYVKSREKWKNTLFLKKVKNYFKFDGVISKAVLNVKLWWKLTQHFKIYAILFSFFFINSSLGKIQSFRLEKVSRAVYWRTKNRNNIGIKIQSHTIQTLKSCKFN